VTKARKAETMSEEELVAWDAEIEADFQRTVAKTKTLAQLERQPRHIGCPWEFLADVCRHTRGRTALVVAVYAYRQTKVRHNRTVTLSSVELGELGVSRPRRYAALRSLEAAGLVQLHKSSPGQTTAVTMLWKPMSRRRNGVSRRRNATVAQA
jgi:hypothetical protein